MLSVLVNRPRPVESFKEVAICIILTRPSRFGSSQVEFFLDKP